jgi:hypothetical protein
MIGLGLNQWYFIFTNPEEETKTPLSKVATVITSENDNERKHGHSDMWNPLKTGDALFINDTIRTANSSILQFQFIGTDKIIDIEPESLLVLQQTAGKINLELLDGKLLVKKLKNLKSETNGSSITVAGESLDNQALLAMAPETQSATGLSIKLTAPKDLNTLFYNPQQNDLFRVQFESLPEGFTTELWMGHKPQSLSLITRGGISEIVGPRLDKGVRYWQVRAKRGPETIQTAVVKTEVVTRYPPAPLQPVNQALIRLRHPEDKTKLMWFKHQDFTSITVEIADLDDTKKMVFRDSLVENQISLNLAPRKYQWRFTGHTKDTETQFLSAWYYFEIVLRSQINVGLQWTENTLSTQNFVGETPMLNLQWLASNTDLIRNYRVRIWPENQTREHAVVQTLTDKLYSVRLPASGRYMASIDALDDEGEHLGSTGQRRFEVKPLPLLPQLKLETSQKNNWVETDAEGNINLMWAKLDEAQSYVLRLADRNGEKIRDEVLEQNERSLIDLLPGNYNLTLFAIDKYGRQGEKRHWPLIVPEPTQLLMPKIKKWEVE